MLKIISYPPYLFQKKSFLSHFRKSSRAFTLFHGTQDLAKLHFIHNAYSLIIELLKSENHLAKSRHLFFICLLRGQSHLVNPYSLLLINLLLQSRNHMTNPHMVSYI